MTKEQYRELKRLQAEIAAGLRKPNLSPEARAQLEHAQATVSGALLSIWLPMDWSRRLIMAALVLVGLPSFALYPHYQWLLWAWLLAALMSPRIGGAIFHAAGRARR